MKLCQLRLDAVSTKVLCVVRTCLEYLAIELCFYFYSEKAHQMDFISSFLD